MFARLYPWLIPDSHRLPCSIEVGMLWRQLVLLQPIVATAEGLKNRHPAYRHEQQSTMMPFTTELPNLPGVQKVSPCDHPSCLLPININIRLPSRLTPLQIRAEPKFLASLVVLRYQVWRTSLRTTGYRESKAWMRPVISELDIICSFGADVLYVSRQGFSAWNCGQDSRQNGCLQ